MKGHTEVGIVTETLDGLMGEMANVWKVVEDFGDSKVQKSARQEDIMMLQYLPAGF